MEEIIKILMERDGMTYDEAKEAYEETKEELMEAIDGDSVLDPEEVLLGIGLEMDYIFDFI